MRYYSIKGAAMRKMEENMGIFKDDEEKTTENVSLPEDLNLDDIGDDLARFSRNSTAAGRGEPR